MQMKKKLLLGLTTTSRSDWREKIEEIEKFNIKEIALFPTCLEIEDRKKMYSLLEGTGLNKIPFVHLRHDMESWELDHLKDRYGTEVFNVHSDSRGIDLINKNNKYRDIICVENHYGDLDTQRNFTVDAFEKNNIAGACLDLAHLKNEELLYPDKYLQTKKVIDTYPIMCNHISAIAKEPYSLPGEMRNDLDLHYLIDWNDLEYQKTFPNRYFSNIIALELENTFEEQLRVKSHISKWLNI